MQLLFIPGLLCTALVWGQLNTLRTAFDSLDANVYDFDVIDDMLDYIANSIDPKQEYCVISSSMGGYVALSLALRQYDWLKKLVLLNTTADAVDPATLALRYQAIDCAKKNDLDGILKLSNGVCFFDKKPDYLAIEHAMAKTVGCQAYIRQQHIIINRPALVNQLDQIHLPTLVVSCREDQVLPYQDSITLFEKIPQAQLTLFNAVGHLPTLEHALPTANLIKSFIQF